MNVNSLKSESLLDQVGQDIKEAMKGQQKDRLSALRMLKSSLIENKTASSPRPELEVVIAHCKKLKDAIQNFPAGSPEQEKLQQEISFLKSYMPESMSEDEVKSLIKNIIASQEKPNFGMIMKELSPQIKGRFEGKAASNLVQEMLKNQ